MWERGWEQLQARYIFSIRLANLAICPCENIPNELQILEIKQRKKEMQPQFTKILRTTAEKTEKKGGKPVNSNFPSSFSNTPLSRATTTSVTGGKELIYPGGKTQMQMQRREASTLKSLDNDETEDWVKEKWVQGIPPPFENSRGRGVARFDKRLDGSRSLSTPFVDLAESRAWSLWYKVKMAADGEREGKS